MKKRNILIINAHWNNRGDEAALRSLIDSLLEQGYSVKVQIQSPTVEKFPYKNVEYTSEYPRLRTLPGFLIAIVTGFRVVPSSGKRFVEMMKEADLIIHAPGGPSIGDIYGIKEFNYLYKFIAAQKMGKPYVFCAPSAGPFKKNSRNGLRRKVYKSARAIVLREQISQGFLNELIPDNKSVVTCDMALRNDIDLAAEEKKLNANAELKTFIESGKVVGITITDLLWHPIHSKNENLQDAIKHSFTAFLEYVTDNGYKAIFIPQLFGTGNDYELMSKYCINDQCYVLSGQYDTYFQQYLISKLYAVVGMRYHSNIFSAKMNTPFISISYEQKMKGFVKRIDLMDYCIDINELSEQSIVEKFKMLEENRDTYKEHLTVKSKEMKVLAQQTMEVIQGVLKELEK